MKKDENEATPKEVWAEQFLSEFVLSQVNDYLTYDQILKAMQEYATLKTAEKDAEIARLRKALNIMICGYYDWLSEESLLECEAVLNKKS